MVIETINGEKFRPCKIKVLEIRDRKTKLEVQITEGKNREIRKIFDKFGNKVNDDLIRQIEKNMLELRINKNNNFGKFFASENLIANYESFLINSAISELCLTAQMERRAKLLQRFLKCLVQLLLKLTQNQMAKI